MNVVVRGLMTAGMWLYAAIHIQQAFAPPPGSPGWMGFAFAASAAVAALIGVMLIVSAVGGEKLWENAAALLASVSAVALIAAFTVGLAGFVETGLRIETALVVVAEVVVVGAWAINRVRDPATADEDLHGPVRPRNIGHIDNGGQMQHPAP